MKIKTPLTEFEDAVEMHRQNPETFKLPLPKEIAAIKGGQGWTVKLCNSGERFWATVETVDEDGILNVCIDNELTKTHIHGLQDKDRVRIQHRHIYQVDNQYYEN